MFVEAFMKTGIRYQQRKEGTEGSQQQMQKLQNSLTCLGRKQLDFFTPASATFWTRSEMCLRT